MDKLYTTKEVAEIFSVTEYTVRNWLKDEKLEGLKTKVGRWRVTESALKEFANKEYGEASAS